MVVLPTSLVDPRGGVGETVGGATLQPRCVACAGWRRDGIRDSPCPLDDREAATRGPSTVGRRPHVARRRLGGGHTWPLDGWEAATRGLSTVGRTVERPRVAGYSASRGQLWPRSGGAEL